MAHHLDVLRGNILLRKEENYLHPDTENEMNELKTGSHDEDMIRSVFVDFFGNFLFNLSLFLSVFFIALLLFLLDNAMNYLSRWTEQFEVFQTFSWVVLKEFPEWSKVKDSMRLVGQKGSFDIGAKSAAVFDQFGYVKKFCSPEKLSEWNSNKVPTEKRWVQIFKHMEARNVPFEEFAAIIEFILCFPGTSASVERIFAKAKKIWKQESSQLEVSTLESMLQVKCNMDWTCTEFFDFLKTRPDLLQKISSQDKYSFKRPQLLSLSPMSVDLTDLESER